MKWLASGACILAICTMGYRPGSGYEERRSAMDDYRYTIMDAAEVFGYSAIPIPPEVYTCMVSDAATGTMRCMVIPPGSILLIPTEPPDSLEVR